MLKVFIFQNYILYKIYPLKIGKTGTPYGKISKTGTPYVKIWKTWTPYGENLENLDTLWENW